MDKERSFNQKKLQRAVSVLLCRKKWNYIIIVIRLDLAFINLSYWKLFVLCFVFSRYISRVSVLALLDTKVYCQRKVRLRLVVKYFDSSKIHISQPVPVSLISICCRMHGSIETKWKIGVMWGLNICEYEVSRMNHFQRLTSFTPMSHFSTPWKR